MNEFKKIWKNLDKDGSLSYEEAQKGKKIFGILSLISLAITILFGVLGEDSLLSMLALPFGFLFMVVLSKFFAANTILTKLDNTTCKNCKSQLVFDENSSFKKISEKTYSTRVSDEKKATGNLIVTDEGDHYKVSEEKKMTYKNVNLGKGVEVEYSCKCRKCNTVNTGKVELQVANYTDEVIRKALENYFKKPSVSK